MARIGRSFRIRGIRAIRGPLSPRSSHRLSRVIPPKPRRIRAMAQPSASANSFRLDTQNNLAVLTFDQPGSRANTLGQAVFGELEQIVGQLEKQKELQGLVFQSGKAGMFIAGADLKELAIVPDDAAIKRHVVKRGLDLFGRIEALPFPTIALIDG